MEERDGGAAGAATGRGSALENSHFASFAGAYASYCLFAFVALSERICRVQLVLLLLLPSRCSNGHSPPLKGSGRCWIQHGQKTARDWLSPRSKGPKVRPWSGTSSQNESTGLPPATTMYHNVWAVERLLPAMDAGLAHKSARDRTPCRAPVAGARSPVSGPALHYPVSPVSVAVVEVSKPRPAMGPTTSHSRVWALAMSILLAAIHASRMAMFLTATTTCLPQGGCTEQEAKS